MIINDIVKNNPINFTLFGKLKNNWVKRNPPVKDANIIINTLNNAGYGATISFERAKYYKDFNNGTGTQFRNAIITVKNSNVTVNFNESVIVFDNLYNSDPSNVYTYEYNSIGGSANRNNITFNNGYIKFIGGIWVPVETSYVHGYGSTTYNHYYNNMIFDLTEASYGRLAYLNGSNIRGNNLKFIINRGDPTNLYINRGRMTGYTVVYSDTPEGQQLLRKFK